MAQLSQLSQPFRATTIINRCRSLLGSRLGLYTAKQGTIEIRIDEIIPSRKWNGRLKTMRKLVREYADPPIDGSAYVYLMYLTRYKDFRGLSFQPGHLSKHAEFPLAFIYTDQLESILWLSGARQEGSVLVHEVGHLMGLVTNPAHYVDGHCTNSWCLMYDGLDARSIAIRAIPILLTGYIPTKFCRDCQKDLWPDEALPGRDRVEPADVRIRRRKR